MDTKMMSLAISPLIVWSLTFVYMLLMDRKLVRIENRRKDDGL